jgi:hypothetical protein
MGESAEALSEWLMLRWVIAAGVVRGQPTEPQSEQACYGAGLRSPEP